MPEQKITDQSRKRGNRLGFAFFKASIALFGLKGTYGFLYFVCLYYVLFDRPVFSVTMAYVNRRFRSYGFIRKVYCVFRIFINQGKSLIDRYCLISGDREFDFEVYGYDRLEALMAGSGKGFILLTAHVGNWQAAMTSLEKFKRDVYLLMRPEENRAVKEMLDIDRDREKVKIISTDAFLGGVVEIVNMINAGNIVSIMGDRSYGHNSIEVPFMGDMVRFPYGAFNIAAATGCPIVVFLSAKIATRKYFVDISHIIEPLSGERRRKMEGIRERAGEFARILEGFLERYPFQWFMFDDIWAGCPEEKTVLKEQGDA
jgi:predicted LPLAT superfamily acyltransferase